MGIVLEVYAEDDGDGCKAQAFQFSLGFKKPQIELFASTSECVSLKLESNGIICTYSLPSYVYIFFLISRLLLKVSKDSAGMLYFVFLGSDSQ